MRVVWTIICRTVKLIYLKSCNTSGGMGLLPRRVFAASREAALVLIKANGKGGLPCCLFSLWLGR
jgi:hypothetical protein